MGMAAVGNRLVILFPVLRILFIFGPLFFTFKYSSAQSNSHLSCGNIADIRYPFRLKGNPNSHGEIDLDCQDNRTVLNTISRRYNFGFQNNGTVPDSSPRWFYVQEIDYKENTIRLVDPGINKENLSSCPLYTYGYLFDWPNFYNTEFSYHNVPVAFIYCLSPVRSMKYVEAPFCGNRSSVFANSSQFYSYAVITREVAWILDVEEGCTVEMVAWVSSTGPTRDGSSLTHIYDGLAYGFKVSFNDLRRETCWHASYYSYWPTAYSGWHEDTCCYRDSKFQPLRCAWKLWAPMVGLYCGWIIVVLLGLRFFVGFPLLVWLVVGNWRRRHLSMDETIEKFLQSQHNFTPIRYTYKDIKKMTNNFTQKLGEGGYGTVYKGKLQSGPYAAIKMMEQSMASEEEFINELGTIGQIHHVNIVQLIGFCLEDSKCALVYEFLPNGSLDRYIFNQQSVDIAAMSYEKMLDIALGVANGINYLHHGCHMQILHFDIKPHNILLDEKFNPKISDFGLAQLHPTNESFINLTTARGTIGYMAPEMFYKNFGLTISHKADVYSFGMMLMEMVGRRKNITPLVEDTSQMYFPSWVYDRLCAGKDVVVKDATEEEERRIVKKIIIVALWCIQMRPSNRPAMNKVVEMLECDSELQMPPKPFVAPQEIAAANDHDHGMRTYSVDDISFVSTHS